MKGIIHIEVENNRKIKYTFDLFRNITLVQGFSGTGKTTLYNMIRNFASRGESSGVKINCNKKCVVLYDEDLWKSQLEKISDCIIFIDEGASFITSTEFAGSVKNSDNYFVIFSREPLHYLPYSVDEIYEIKSSGKKHTFEKRFPSDSKHHYSDLPKDFQKNIVLVEDKGSGFQFFKSVYKKSNLQCLTAEGKANVFKMLSQWKTSTSKTKILVIADGAAFGNEMNRVMTLCEENPFIYDICLPESFEWLILKSGLIDGNEVQNILKNPSDYIDSKDFFSWENYFYELLKNKTANIDYMKYNKDELKPFYTEESKAEKIIKEI